MSRNTTMLIKEPISHQKSAEDNEFPLRNSKGFPEVLLVGFTEIKELLEQKIGYMCEEVQTE
jgi:hypothetical protein